MSTRFEKGKMNTENEYTPNTNQTAPHLILCLLTFLTTNKSTGLSYKL